jgi:hypothetical protein
MKRRRKKIKKFKGGEGGGDLLSPNESIVHTSMSL